MFQSNSMAVLCVRLLMLVLTNGFCTALRIPLRVIRPSMAVTALTATAVPAQVPASLKAQLPFRASTTLAHFTGEALKAPSVEVSLLQTLGM